MEITELKKQLAWLNKKLFTLIESQPDLVEKHGKAEYAYRVSLSSEMLRLKTDGQSVTLIPDLAKGNKEVANLRLEYHIAEGLADSNREAIRATTSSISSIQCLVAVERARSDKGLYEEGG